VSSAREAGHVCADFGDQHLGNTPTDAGDRIQSFDERLERTHTLGNLGAHAVDTLIQ
jgi:hypothetical protein